MANEDATQDIAQQDANVEKLNSAEDIVGKKTLLQDNSNINEKQWIVEETVKKRTESVKSEVEGGAPLADSIVEVKDPNVPEPKASIKTTSHGSSSRIEKSSKELQQIDENYNKKTVSDKEEENQPTDICSKIPGSFGSTIRHGIEMLTMGHHYFSSRMKKYQSCVFKANLFGAHFISVTDHQGLQCLFDTDKFEKEPSFGNFKLNKQLVDQHIPSMFRNGEDHAKQKKFLLSLAKHLTLKKLLPVAMRIIPEHLSKWQFKTDRGTESQEQWENKILLLTSDLMSEAILGSRQDGQCFLDWRFQVLMPEKGLCGRPSEKQRKALGALENLRETVADCPNIEKIIKEAAKYGINEEEAIMDVLWMMNFNAAPGTGAAIRSAVARVSTLTEDEKDILKSEIQTCLGTEGLNYRTLKKMKLLDSFILEVLRMHPPVALYFGVAKKDVIIQSKTGSYEVKTGQRVLGSCHLAQRDPSVFSNSAYKDPEEFDYKRFKEKGMKKKLVFSHGLLNKKPTPEDHSCAGHAAGILTTKIVIMYLILFCDWELEEKPYWSDKSLIRYGNPDEPIRLNNFNYTRDKKKLLIPDDKEDELSDEDEISGSDSDSDDENILGTL